MTTGRLSLDIAGGGYMFNFGININEFLLSKLNIKLNKSNTFKDIAVKLNTAKLWKVAYLNKLVMVLRLYVANLSVGKKDLKSRYAWRKLKKKSTEIYNLLNDNDNVKEFEEILSSWYDKQKSLSDSYLLFFRNKSIAQTQVFTFKKKPKYSGMFISTQKRIICIVH